MARRRLCQRPLSCRYAEASGLRSRTAVSSSPTAVYEVWAVLGGQLADDERPLRRGWSAAWTSCASTMPMSRAALTLVLRELIRRNRVTRRHRLSAGHPRRRPPRPPLPASRRRPADRGRHRQARSTARPRQAKAAKGVGRDHPAGHPLGPLRHQDGGPAAQRPGQAGRRARAGAYEAWLVDKDWAWSPRAPRPTPGSSTRRAGLRTRDTQANILRGITRTTLIDLARGLQNFPCRGAGPSRWRRPRRPRAPSCRRLVVFRSYPDHDEIDGPKSRRLQAPESYSDAAQGPLYRARRRRTAVWTGELRVNDASRGISITPSRTASRL